MIWIAEPNLREDIGGHYGDYVAAIQREFVSRGTEVKVLGHASGNGARVDVASVEPVFRQCGHDPRFMLATATRVLNWWRGRHPRHLPKTSLIQAPVAAPVTASVPGPSVWRPRILAGIDFLDNLGRQAIHLADLQSAASRLGRPSLVFFPTVHPALLEAIHRWTRRNGLASGGVAVVMLRYNLRRHDGATDLHALRVLRAASDEVSRGRIRLVSDSQRLASDYSSVSGLPLSVVPIPHTIHAPSSVTNVQDPQSGVRFVVLGEARNEKGWPVIVEAISRLAQRGQLQGMQFTLQCNLTTGHETMREHTAKLVSLKSPMITLLERRLTTAEYWQALQTADVVLLPYRRIDYVSRTSGPLTEALALGKAVIVTRDTWLSDQIAGTGAGLEVEDGDAELLSAAMLRSAREVEQLRTAARALQPRWCSFHNPASLVDALLTLSSAR